ncbi:MAG: elongation factor 4 [Planctomycetes bacterium]|nr:elongation factor 4 [Planctomycetota bacterium]
MNQDHIRNFCIIAHVDHGKSTLADRLLEVTGSLRRKDAGQEQVLDSMDLERERGITIKAKAVALNYHFEGQDYLLNLIDTPGHVDFAYEVARSLRACEGALLLVDASQGVEAQTIANSQLAQELGLELIPVINKIDLPHARPVEVADEIEHNLLLEKERCRPISAKQGIGVDAVLAAIVKEIPPPRGRLDAPLRALLFDAEFDDYRGVIAHLRIVDGVLRKRDVIKMIEAKAEYEVLEIGRFRPHMEPCAELRAGEVGYLIANVKSLEDIRIGDTVTAKGAVVGVDVQPLPGYREPLHMVYCGIYPTANKDFEALRKALQKLQLNDASFSFSPETSDALGFGFRCGFLGLLHMEIVQERLERHSGLDIVQTSPTVTYEVVRNDDSVLLLSNPAELPDPTEIKEMREPIVRLRMVVPIDTLGAMLKLAIDRHGRLQGQEHVSATRVLLTFEIPLAEIIFDFFDKMKSITRGYGTMDYEFIGHREAPLIKLRILVGGDEVDALSIIVHREEAESRGRQMLLKLREEIPRHMFEVALQAAINGKIVARESIKALSKHVTAKCYGGDVTRKRKLLEKQKEGKKRMKMVGNVEIPQKAFLAVLQVER